MRSGTTHDLTIKGSRARSLPVQVRQMDCGEMLAEQRRRLEDMPPAPATVLIIQNQLILNN
ncbi:putative uncharacterized protein [Pseudomonas sp. StFLB209]|nr:putative uncharacterized protein [Pseudomonas sp. StFLB209]